VALRVGALVSGLGMVLLILAVCLRDLLIYLLATAAAGGRTACYSSAACK
jgi:hypothetical protein